ncbi:hypothetical protein S-CBS4_gp100 [Synechococcus phage S-CBS4]|uniref:hypothetical protein n=1 Tax=Synechococcus phage S-CBS4 TaxID=756275 RepID=UPI000246A73C|nr:hypothetical protein S-CBS4_gp100 [Synechococcus phage S-CBS4]AEX56067.1 hypothetical protein S-CBS4_gp100 [Synechococcus phage S-CBS4]
MEVMVTRQLGPSPAVRELYTSRGRSPQLLRKLSVAPFGKDCQLSHARFEPTPVINRTPIHGLFCMHHFVKQNRKNTCFFVVRIDCDASAKPIHAISARILDASEITGPIRKTAFKVASIEESVLPLQPSILTADVASFVVWLEPSRPKGHMNCHGDQAI